MILGDADLSCILEQDVFHRSLLVCCLEIVVFSYRPPGDFPNLIAIFQLPAYHFYKVIEVLVRSEQGLFREVVKHLNQVEEQVLESLAWTSDSPLWESLRGAKEHVPACQQVMPPQYLEHSDESSSGSVPLTPVSHGLDLSTNSTFKGPVQLSTQRPILSPSVRGPAGQRAWSHRQHQQHQHSTGSQDGPGQPGHDHPSRADGADRHRQQRADVSIPVHGIANESGGITFIPVPMSVTGQGQLQPLTGTLTVQSAVTKPATKPSSSPLKKGSLSLFFRKVYHLASVRLRDLCAKLDISSKLRRKIWTCFEYSLVHCTDLMMDRHLDQILMCAVYVMAKVYRSVLISGRRRHSDNNDKQNSSADIMQDPAGGDISPVLIRSSSTLPTPSLAVPPPPRPTPPTRTRPHL
ncbi:Retinoblastoma-like protein 2 [Larimichthys crocea]|uniref:Retinoblastoma-like protein 2 n=1 Tax=Larimichthys crocea TaxID=215358 RepID=A0A6G0HDK5_LARCR|nr:Retinoblastoma-like protein 2 [Larimichthys crocea]